MGSGATDEREAAKWLRVAARQLPMAQYLHGRMLAEGRGEEPDLYAARTLFARAAAAGVVEAKAALAEMMLNGRCERMRCGSFAAPTARKFSLSVVL